MRRPQNNILEILQDKDIGKLRPRTGSTLSLTSAPDVGGWLTPCLGRFNFGNDPVPIVQEAEWIPGPVRTGAENLCPPVFDLRTVQAVASRYAD